MLNIMWAKYEMDGPVRVRQQLQEEYGLEFRSEDFWEMQASGLDFQVHLKETKYKL